MVDERRTRIGDAFVEYEVLRVHLRLAFDYRLLSERQFEHSSNLLNEIARLLRDWQKSSKRSITSDVVPTVDEPQQTTST